MQSYSIKIQGLNTKDQTTNYKSEPSDDGWRPSTWSSPLPSARTSDESPVKRESLAMDDAVSETLLAVIRNGSATH